jgi:PIN domain nuclease of toxin-antitoxin system
LSPLLLDTCAAIWLVEGQSLSKEAQTALASATADGLDTFVSPISAWEVAMLAAKQRLRLPLTPLAWFENLMAKPRIAAADLSARILVASCTLPGSPPSDPMDRIITATARENGYRLITRDKQLLDYAKQGHVVALAC